MSANQIKQLSNYIAQGIHNGDNYITYNHFNDISAQINLKQYAKQTHEKVKAAWRNIGTCTWLLDKSEYQSWVKMENPNSFLWVYGLQGCGKTILMSWVVENICQQRDVAREPEAIHLLYFYVGYGDDAQKQQFYRTMLMTFWEQTIKQDNGRSFDVFGSHSSDEEIQDGLNSFLSTAQRDVYMVVDGLDQLPHWDRRKLLRGLNDLVQRRKDERNAHRFAAIISCRDYLGYDTLREHTLLQIQVKPSDNIKDIQTYLRNRIASFLFDDHKKFKEYVVLQLANKADGMFLWARLQAAEVCTKGYERDIRNLLRTMMPPSQMHEIYKKYSDEFESSGLPETERNIALRTLALLSQTTGSMPKEILLVALALDMNDGKPDPITYNDLREEPAKIVRTCKHLIDMDDELGTFRFCHGSVFEFFRQHQPAIDHGLIAELCLAHLSSSDFSKGPPKDAKWYNYGDLRPMLKTYPFLEFASCNWAISMRKSAQTGIGLSTGNLHDRILGLFESLLEKPRSTVLRRNLQLSFQVFLLGMDRSMPAGVRHEHIISYFALLEYFDIFNKKGCFDLTKRDHEGSTAIHWAIRNRTGQDDKMKEIALVVERLIEYGGDKDAQDNEGRTPLYYASHYGNLHVVALLLEKGARVNIRTKEHETALIIACRMHHEDIVSKLVAAGADVRVRGSVGTALQVVSLIGCHHCAGLLLKQYGEAPIEEADGPLGTPLHIAAFQGHAKVVRLLCEKGFNVHATDETYGSVLTAAATGCNPGKDPAPFREIFQELIRHGVDVNDPSGACGPALRAAAFSGYTELVQILLDAGAEVRLAKGPMGTAYEAADDKGYQEIKELLLKSDPNAAANDKGDPNALVTVRDLVMRNMFRGILKVNNPVIINGLFEQYEKYFEKEARKGKTRILEGMIHLGADLFNDVIQLATASSIKAEAGKGTEMKVEQTIVEERKEESKEKATEEAVTSKERRKRFRSKASCFCCKDSTEDGEAPRNRIVFSVPEPSVSRAPIVRRRHRSRPTSRHKDPTPKSAIEQRQSSSKTASNNSQSDSPDSTSRQGKYVSKDPPAQIQPTPTMEIVGKHPTLKSTLSLNTSNLVPSFLRRYSTSFERDNLEGYYPEVLDRMTRFAVKILETAIFGGDPQVIKFVANTWVESLNLLISYDGFGESMLEKVVQNRAVELKQHLMNSELDMDARFKQAEGLARVGMELLLTAVGRGPRFYHLSFILSKLWVLAVNGVEDLGPQGREYIWKLISLFKGKFSSAIKSRDSITADISGHAGMEFLKGAALSPRRSLIYKLGEEWAMQWDLAIEEHMEDTTNELMRRRWEEYQNCVINKKHEEALGIAVAGMEILRGAIELRLVIVAQTLLPIIISGCRFTVDKRENQLEQAVSSHLQGKRGGVDVERIFDTVVHMLSTAEKTDPGCLHELAATILDVMEKASKETRQSLTRLVHQRIQIARKGVHAPELDPQLRDISLTVLYLLNEARSENTPKTVAVLKDVAQALPGVRGRGDFSRYEKALGFLKF